MKDLKEPEILEALQSQRPLKFLGDDESGGFFCLTCKIMLDHFGNIGHHLIVAIIDHIPNVG